MDEILGECVGGLEKCWRENGCERGEGLWRRTARRDSRKIGLTNSPLDG